MIRVRSLNPLQHLFPAALLVLWMLACIELFTSASAMDASIREAKARASLRRPVAGCARPDLERPVSC